MFIKNFALITIVILSTLSPICQAFDFKVVFLNPGYPNDNATGRFWSNVSLFMNAAAKDLDIELITLYANRNHILMKSLTKEIISHQPKYIILVNEKGIASNIIKGLAPHKIPIFMLLNNLSKQDLSSLTNKEKDVIKGSVVPNNYLVGKQLIKGLIDIHESLPPTKINGDRPKTLLALGGDFTTPASLERERGLLDIVNFNKKIELLDNSVANWSKKQAYHKVKGLLQRKRIDIIWAANDAMAFGAKTAVDESNLTYPVAIGGVNWDVEEKISPINLSYGGHVTLGALALTMLKDIDSNTLPNKERHKIINIFESSLSEYYPLFVSRLDVKKLKHYDFSKFTRSARSPLEFNIKNLSKSYYEPIKEQ